MYMDLSPPTIDFQNLFPATLSQKRRRGIKCHPGLSSCAKPDDQSPIPRTIMVKEENRLLQAIPWSVYICYAKYMPASFPIKWIHFFKYFRKQSIISGMVTGIFIDNPLPCLRNTLDDRLFKDAVPERVKTNAMVEFLGWNGIWI